MASWTVTATLSLTDLAERNFAFTIFLESPPALLEVTAISDYSKSKLTHLIELNQEIQRL